MPYTHRESKVRIIRENTLKELRKALRSNETTEVVHKYFISLPYTEKTCLFSSLCFACCFSSVCVACLLTCCFSSCCTSCNGFNFSNWVEFCSEFRENSLFKTHDFLSDRQHNLSPVRDSLWITCNVHGSVTNLQWWTRCVNQLS